MNRPDSSPFAPTREGTDPWLSVEAQAQPSVDWHKGKQVARRGVGLVVLLGLALLGAALLLPLVLLLGFGVANGSAPAGWLLVLVLLLGLAGLVWTGFRAKKLLRPLSPATPPPGTPDDEGELLALLRHYDQSVGEPLRPAFYATVLATRDALRATANETTLTRESFDARQAARSDLPELLSTYRALPATTSRDQEFRDREFLEQLRLIETRMREVQVGQQHAQQRQLQASGKYLREKYQAAEVDSPKGSRSS